MSDLFENHTVDFLKRWLKCLIEQLTICTLSTAKLMSGCLPVCLDGFLLQHIK